MKKNIRKVKSFQKTLVCLIGILLLVVGFVVGKITNANADEINYEYESNNIDYDNSTSNLSSTNVKDAIDELYSKVGKCPVGQFCVKLSDIYNSNIVKAYTYDESTCVTGNETGCVETNCYKASVSNACSAGTIIDYKVNDTEIVRFHVLHDNGTTMTMQAQRNTVYNTAWYSGADNHKDGPQTIMAELKTETNDWSNVKDITLADGMTQFNDGTSANNKCTGTSCSPADNSYGYPYSKLVNNVSMGSTVKARMITITEISALGCTTSNKSCPIYLYNYLYDSVSQCRVSGKCTNDQTGGSNYGYWTMSAHTSNAAGVWLVYLGGRVDYGFAPNTVYGARAVVFVDK